jgi:hypothetical protein
VRTLILAALCMHGWAASALTQSTCRASDAVSTTMLGDLRRLATSTDSVFVAQRTSANLPATTATNVNLVTNGSTCQKAVTALNSIFVTPNQPRQVYLFSFGSSFVTADPALPDSLGGVGARYVFSKQWALQVVWLP